MAAMYECIGCVVDNSRRRALHQAQSEWCSLGLGCTQPTQPIKAAHLSPHKHGIHAVVGLIMKEGNEQTASTLAGCHQGLPMAGVTCSLHSDIQDSDPHLWRSETRLPLLTSASPPSSIACSPWTDSRSSSASFASHALIPVSLVTLTPWPNPFKLLDWNIHSISFASSLPLCPGEALLRARSSLYMPGIAGHQLFSTQYSSHHQEERVACGTKASPTPELLCFSLCIIASFNVYRFSAQLAQKTDTDSLQKR